MHTAAVQNGGCFKRTIDRSRLWTGRRMRIQSVLPEQRRRPGVVCNTLTVQTVNKHQQRTQTTAGEAHDAALHPSPALFADMHTTAGPELAPHLWACWAATVALALRIISASSCCMWSAMEAVAEEEKGGEGPRGVHPPWEPLDDNPRAQT